MEMELLLVIDQKVLHEAECPLPLTAQQPTTVEI